MKKDGEIKLLLSERAKGASQKLAAARADICVRTARKYERAGKLPSQLKQPRTYRTRPNPFADDWPWVDGAAGARSGAAGEDPVRAAVRRAPGRYQAGQLRTLQRQSRPGGSPWPGAGGHLPAGPPPGRMAQSDFTP